MTVLPTDYSSQAIERRFQAICPIQVAGIDAHLYWCESSLVASVISDALNENGRHSVIASLELEKTKWNDQETMAVERFWEQDPNQVRGVVVDPRIRDFGLATFMYETLALKLNMTLVSDNEQYEGGKALWKKIATESNKLDVFVYDEETCDFYPFGDDGRVIYKGTNIDDEDLWSIDPDYSKHHILFVAESK